MKNSGEIQIASRYASALFDAAKAASALAPVEKDLRDFARAAQENEELSEFISSPLLNRAQQTKIITAMADSFKAHAVTKSFLTTLADQRRLRLVAEIAEQFTKMAEEERGEMSAELISAIAVSKEEEQLVTDRLAKIYGKKIKLHVRQDPKLLGGAIIKIGGMQLDASVAGKLERMNIALKAA